MGIFIDEGNFRRFHIGAKARNLFLMQEKGVNVPAFFVVDGKWLEENGDVAELTSLLAEYMGTKYEATTFSVRSSALCEDNEEFSFAGQFETFLFVKKQKLAEMIIACYNSLKSENVARYCRSNGIKNADLHMCVIVQEMVVADMSGVIFSANPQGLLNEAVIVIGSGTGNNVVEEKVPVTTYYYSLTDSVYYFEQQEKAITVPEKTINLLMEQCKNLQADFGEFIDIEFAFHDDELFILQVRPITTVSDENLLILDNSNIVESYPNVSSPLTVSFVSNAYYGVFKGVAQRCLKNKKLVQKYDSVFQDMTGAVNGRIYYKISNWYSLIQFLPFSRKIIPIWQDMMGVFHKAHLERSDELNLFHRFMTYIYTIHEALHVQGNMKRLNESFSEIEKVFSEGFSESDPPDKLAHLYEDLQLTVMKKWDITLLNDMYTFIFTGLLKRKIKRLGFRDYEELTNAYVSGISNIESMKPVKAIISLSVLARDSGALKALSEMKTNEDVRLFLRNDNSEFSAAFRGYIRLYGDRTIEELKLETKTFRVSPILLVEKIMSYNADKSRLNELCENLLGDEKPKYLPGNVRKKAGFFGMLYIRFLSKHAIKGINNREISRMNRCRLYGMVREIFISIGKTFAAQKRIVSPDDIFFLRTDEIFSEIFTPTGKDFTAIVTKRRGSFKMYEQLPAYTRLVFSEKTFNKSHHNINTINVERDFSGILTGTPCSAGITEGEIRVIIDIGNTGDVSGKIIVAKMTDPGWVFLLAKARGIIVEKGSLLSHTAIISRELGLPSVVGVSGASTLLKDGDKVRLDGNTGEIEVLK